MAGASGLAEPSSDEVEKWAERIRAASGARLSLPRFKDGFLYATYDHPDRLPVLVRIPVGGSIGDAKTLVDPREFAGGRDDLIIQSWQFVGDETIAFCLADETENGVLRFLDVATGESAGRPIEGFRWDTLAQFASGDALFHTVHLPEPLGVGRPETRVRIGGLNGRDVRVEVPDQVGDPVPGTWPGVSVYQDGDRYWLVASHFISGGMQDVHVAELSPSEEGVSRPQFDKGIRLNVRGGLHVADGVATFVSTDLGRRPRGAVFQAPIASLTDRSSWTTLVPMPQTPGAHLHGVQWVGSGEHKRLLVRRTWNGAEMLDVHAADARPMYTIDGPPGGGTAALYGTAAMPEEAGAAPGVLLSWGDVNAAEVHEYRLEAAGPQVQRWALDREIAASAPVPPVATETYEWRARYAEGKVAVARLVLAAGTDPEESVGTIVEQYNHYQVSQGPAGGFKEPQRYAPAWLGRGGGVLTVMLEDPVAAATEAEAAEGVAAVLRAGAHRRLVRPAATILTGTSAAAVTVARMVQDHSGTFGLGVFLHGLASRDEAASKVGVGPHQAQPGGMGPPSGAARQGGVERLRERGLPPVGDRRPVYLFGGGQDTRVLFSHHAEPFDRAYRERGGESLAVRMADVGHLVVDYARGAVRQGAYNLAVYTGYLAGQAARPVRASGAQLAAAAAGIADARVFRLLGERPAGQAPRDPGGAKAAAALVANPAQHPIAPAAHTRAAAGEFERPDVPVTRSVQAWSARAGAVGRGYGRTLG